MQPWDPECFELSSSLYLCSSLQCCKFWPRRYHPSVLITAFILSSPCSLHSYSTVHPPAEWKNVRTRAFASVNTWEGMQQKHPTSILLFKLMCGSSLSPQTPTNVTHKTYWSSPNIFFPTCFPLSLKRPKKNVHPQTLCLFHLHILHPHAKCPYFCIYSIIVPWNTHMNRHTCGCFSCPDVPFNGPPPPSVLTSYPLGRASGPF